MSRMAAASALPASRAMQSAHREADPVARESPVSMACVRRPVLLTPLPCPAATAAAVVFAHMHGTRYFTKALGEGTFESPRKTLFPARVASRGELILRLLFPDAHRPLALPAAAALRSPLSTLSLYLSPRLGSLRSVQCADIVPSQRPVSPRVRVELPLTLVRLVDYWLTVLLLGCRRYSPIAVPVAMLGKGPQDRSNRGYEHLAASLPPAWYLHTVIQSVTHLAPQGRICLQACYDIATLQCLQATSAILHTLNTVASQFVLSLILGF
jgi:hypothetical protein